MFYELARVVRPGGKIIVADHLADDDAEARSWSQEIERLRDPSHWACLSAAQIRALGERAGLALHGERRFGFELEFEGWLNRGTSNPDAQALVNDALGYPPSAPECFRVASHADRRILTLQIWLGVWQRM